MGLRGSIIHKYYRRPKEIATVSRWRGRENVTEKVKLKVGLEGLEGLSFPDGDELAVLLALREGRACAQSGVVKGREYRLAKVKGTPLGLGSVRLEKLLKNVL